MALAETLAGNHAATLGQPLQIYYIRHGETAWSLSGQHTGKTDIALTARGEDEARSLAPYLSKIVFSHVLTSPRQRAQRTCALAGLGAMAQVEPDLAEWDYGDYEGVVSPDIRKNLPHWNIYRDGCPNGESAGDISSRADRLIGKLKGLSGNVALFSHGQFGSVFGTRWIEQDVSAGQHLILSTASVSILSYKPSDRRVPVIALWNLSPQTLS